MTAEPVDLTGMKEFTDGDKELERELFGEFIVSSQELVETLSQNIAHNGENEQWRQTMHALKGISLNLGAGPLADLCRTGQEHYEDGPEQKSALIEKVKAEHRQVVAFLKQEMDGIPS